ncbi:MAG TPA: UDP-N-acetylglucosamine 2-epimerase (non-hydrolyzing), partial [Bacteroidetes bacterium]|nr:UDP-N-acetylglucosamine 2-epimerase (non-hydrolyzing) [Bacteroidota bacterium]
ERMSKIFFEDLKMPKPHIYLGVGSGTHAHQTAQIMIAFEEILLKYRPDLVLVVGDVNSTIACSLVAAKIRYPETRNHPAIGHVEAGLRSFDRDMPEEANRVLTDHLSDILFTTCSDGGKNLAHEGIPAEKVVFVGNVMIDSLVQFLPLARSSTVLDDLNRTFSERLREPLQEKAFALATLHRPSNVDSSESLSMILEAFAEISRDVPIVFPMHPRTQKLMKGLPDKTRRAIDQNPVLITDPLGYLDFLFLEQAAKLVLTDSGGVQEETSFLNIPCLTLRPNTERPITLTEGTNRLVPLEKEAIIDFAGKSLNGTVKQARSIRFWDGRAAERMVAYLEANRERFI